MTQAQEAAIAQTYGATAMLDPHRGDKWCRYRLGDWTIWVSSWHRNGARWATALLVNDHYTEHAYHDTLEAAFQHVQQTEEVQA